MYPPGNQGRYVLGYGFACFNDFQAFSPADEIFPHHRIQKAVAESSDAFPYD
jgi:hypothetical protein